MAENNRPQGRETNTTGKGKGLYKRGEGLNTGPVGKQDGYQGRKEQYASSGGGGGGGHRATRAIGGGGILIVILAAVLLLGKGGLGGLFGGSTTPSTPTNNTQNEQVQPQPQPQPQQNTSHYGTSGSSILSSLLGGSGNSGLSASGFGGSATASNGWNGGSNNGKLNTSVAAGSRAKRTQIRGNGQDVVTLMIYLCGTDLESRSKMGTMDLQEILSATTNNTNLNILVYTGGCRQWQNNVVSNSKNQLYQIRNGQIQLLGEESARSMTDPNTLVGFIQTCAQAFPANRNMLIFWDHGGGSLSGYGYDEKYASSGSMPLANIDKALKAAGVTFDFIGFDACLMATLETALMLEPYADYMIASEETEPGVGWYYTNWVTALNKNTSISTLELGKMIVDDFVTVCAQKCRGQSTTLSVVDLAELVNTVPSKLKSFASSTSQMLQGQQFQAVSNARSSAREFAASNKIDQVDLVHLAYNLNTSESKALASALVGAVKYNRTSSNMTNAYGLSVYFPYKSTSKVKSATAAFQAIGMDSDYLRCIQQFASMGTAGQTVAGGASSPLGALLGGGSVGSSSNGTQSMDAVMNILGALMGGGRSTEGYIDDSLDLNRAAAFIADNQLDASSLVWVNDESGTPVLRLSEQQWGLVNDLQLNVFVDDGKGYIDLGLDCVYGFTDDGALKGVYDGSWLAIDQQVVAFYYMDSSFDGDSFAINGRVPCLLNGQRAELLVTFDNDHPGGTVTGARTVYDKGETETVAKNFTELSAGDKIDFLCDYYTYDGDYENTYMLGEQMTWTGEETVSNVDISDYETTACYLLTDIYCQEYWTPTMP